MSGKRTVASRTTQPASALGAALTGQSQHITKLTAKLHLVYHAHKLYTRILSRAEARDLVVELASKHPELPPDAISLHNSDGVKDEQGASIKVKVISPPWKSWWAYSLYAMVLVANLYWFVRARIQKVRELAWQQEIALRAEAAEAQAKVVEADKQAAEAKAEAAEADKLAAEAQAQAIEAENQRRAKELEEARQLQLAMLPKSMPQLPDLDIAAYMKTATEVGGDYYDFHLADDGTLTLAVGDATGHGLKAGTVVTAVKSLFGVLAGQPDIPLIFNQSSRALKRMNLRSMFMAMSIVKLKGNRIKVCAAGMPPILIYRASAKQVEEVAIKGVPLGSVSEFAYQQQELTLSEGDAVVMMSDGFPERFNSAGEMLDYGKAKQVLEEVADRSPQEIINRFVEVAERWGNGRPQDDGVTFVVLKVKNANRQQG